MSTEARLHVGDVGTVIELTAKDEDGAVIDIATATTLVISLENQSGVAVEKTATLSGDGSDGKFSYELAEGDLDVDGDWYFQGRVEFAASTWRSQRHRARVYENNAEPS